MEAHAGTVVHAVTEAAMAEAAVGLAEVAVVAGGEGENHETDIKQTTCVDWRCSDG